MLTPHVQKPQPAEPQGPWYLKPDVEHKPQAFPGNRYLSPTPLCLQILQMTKSEFQVSSSPSGSIGPGTWNLESLARHERTGTVAGRTASDIPVGAKGQSLVHMGSELIPPGQSRGGPLTPHSSLDHCKDR